MIIREDNKWTLYPTKVYYNEFGNEKEQLATPSVEWWKEFEELWDHITNLRFEELDLTHEQKIRAEAIADMPEDDYLQLYEHYILTGDVTLPELDTMLFELPVDHPFRFINLYEENKKLALENQKMISENKKMKSDLDKAVIELSMMIGGMMP